MTLRKKLLGVLYYYFLTGTVIFVFLFISTFNYVFDGNKHLGDFAGNWLDILRMMWGVMLALNATGLLAVIVLRRRQAEMSNTRFVLFIALLGLIFAIPPMVFLCRIVWF